MNEEVSDKETITALLTGLGKKYESEGSEESKHTGTRAVRSEGAQSDDKNVSFVKKRNRDRGEDRGAQKRRLAAIDYYNLREIRAFRSQGKTQRKRRKQQESDDTGDYLPGYYNPSKSSGKQSEPVTMIEVVDEETPLPCFANPEVKKDAGTSFFIPFVLDNTSGKAQMKGLVKFVIVDALTKKKVWITVEALYVEGATHLLSQRTLCKDYGYTAQPSED
ncbi:hypothetical protein ON010_g15734 [Phytophthora cinnamomi]|nr:hypothetical protein ON010_g15734 [Phytophthora cinnamomi]